jgi:uncharacterized paraquat-inducible protein A
MITAAIRFSCPACGARIKAPFQLRGRSRTCPRCGCMFVVPHDIPGVAGAILVLLDHEARHAQGVRRREPA